MPTFSISNPAVIGELNAGYVKGQRTFANIAKQRAVPQYTNEVEISVDLAPMYVLTEHLGETKTVQGPIYFHTERDRNPTVIHDSGSGATIGATVLNILSGEGARITVGRTLKILRSNEMMRVSAVSVGTGPGGADQITVTRGLGGIGTVNASEEIELLGFADVEGNISPDAQSSEPAIKQNCVETFRQAYALSGRDISAEVFGTPEVKRIQADATAELMLLIEKTFLFGNCQQLADPYITGGFEFWTSTNVFNYQGNALTDISLRDNFIRPFMRRNQGQKNLYTFAGEIARSAIDGLGLTNIRYKPDDDQIGIEVGYYNSSHGRLKIVPHGLMTLAGTSNNAANNGWAGALYGINMEKCGRRIFKNRNTQLLANRQTPDTDGKKWELLADMGFYLGAELCHCINKGIGG